MAQIALPLGRRIFIPRKGMTVQPIANKLCPSAAILEWKTAMIYKVTASTVDTDVQEVHIKGIAKGREFATLEYSDNIEEKL